MIQRRKSEAIKTNFYSFFSISFLFISYLMSNNTRQLYVGKLIALSETAGSYPWVILTRPEPPRLIPSRRLEYLHKHLGSFLAGLIDSTKDCCLKCNFIKQKSLSMVVLIK